PRTGSDAAALLTGEDARLHDACQAPSCDSFFVRTHERRRWCSTRCGDRVQAARAYEKKGVSAYRGERERCEGASGARLRMARRIVWWQYEAADGGPETVTRGADSVVASGVRVHQTQTAP